MRLGTISALPGGWAILDGFKSTLLDTQNVEVEVIYTKENVPRVLLIFLTALTTVRCPPKF